MELITVDDRLSYWQPRVTVVLTVKSVTVSGRLSRDVTPVTSCCAQFYLFIYLIFAWYAEYIK